MQPVIQQDLIIFYSFLALSLVALALTSRVRLLRAFVSKRIYHNSPISIAEITWFVLAMATILLSLLLSNNFWYGRRIAKWKRSYSALILNNLFDASGDALAQLIGYVFLPVSKNSPLASFFNLPYTSLTRVHTWLGRTLFWLAIFHATMGSGYYYAAGKDLRTTLFIVPSGAVFGKGDYQQVLGVATISILLVVLLTSLSYVRRYFYNVFYFTHFLVFAFLTMAYFHASSCIYYAMPGLILYGIDGLLRLQSRKATHTSTVKEVIFEPCGYVKVTVATTEAANARAGQFMRVNFPAVSMMEYHPWSIVESSADTVTFLFSAPSDKSWSARVSKLLGTISDRSAGDVNVHLQGPYGREIALVTERFDLAVFYVGGTGIAACVQAVNTVLSRNRQNVDKAKTKVLVAWSSSQEQMESLSCVKSWADESKEDFELRLFHTGSSQSTPNGSPNLQIANERANLSALLQKQVNALSSMDLTVGVFICGPPGFSKDALSHVTTFSGARKDVNVRVEVESFEI
ncbi:hypothetical protein HDU82_007028 [Entophlyctis luteolus]|nr:hypothetical protein HDU82_007028 [Entophlyctis luteolus]